jgi:hypothetical protein
MLRIGADHPHHAFAVNDLAFIAHHFYGSSYFHNSTFRQQRHHFVNSSIILPRVRSCGESSTRTRSPGRTLKKFTVAAPAACATTTSSFASFSRYAALGNNSTTTASSLAPGDWPLAPSVTAWSKPTALRPSPPPYARSAPSIFHPRSPPSTCPVSLCYPGPRHLPWVR